MTAPAICLQHISLSFQNTTIFSNVNLNLRAGKWTALLGASGVGKSSLLRLIAGLSSPEEIFSGSISADNNLDVSHQIAWMAQTDMLLPWLTVRDNLLLGFKLRGCSLDAFFASRKRAFVDASLPDAKNASRLLACAKLTHAAHLYPHQLSGGMRQRVALLRTLIENKPIVIMDEPFSSLDTITRYHLHQLAIELLHDKTVLFVTHDPTEALRLADEVYLLTATGVESLGNLSSPAPRAADDVALIKLQSSIYARLLQTEIAA